MANKKKPVEDKHPRTMADKLRAAGVEASRGKNITGAYPEAFTLIRDKNHWLYDPRVDWPLDEARIADFHARGVLTPIIVRENGTDAKGRPILEVIAGRRRVLHAAEHNRRYPDSKLMLKFETVYGTDGDMLLIAMAENGNREGETVGSMAWKANACLRLGKSEEEIMTALGVKSKSTFHNYLSYLNLSPEVQAEIDSGRIPIGNIADFCDVPREKQSAVLEKVVASGATKRHEIKEAIPEAKAGRTPKPAPDRKKIWNRKEMTAFRDTLVENCPDSEEATIARAVVDLFLGDNHAVSRFGQLQAVLKILKADALKRDAKKQSEGAAA